MRGKKIAARTQQTSGSKSYLLDDDDRIGVEIPHPEVVVDERETRGVNEFLRVQAGADAFDLLGIELDVRLAAKLGKKEGQFVRCSQERLNDSAPFLHELLLILIDKKNANGLSWKCEARPSVTHDYRNGRIQRAASDRILNPRNVTGELDRRDLVSVELNDFITHLNAQRQPLRAIDQI